MQQHPVPQNITGFEFKLVGFLTIRQFAYVGGAAVISFILFLLIPGIFKWLFILPVAASGLALAFVPVGGMPFDKWVICFYRLITKPQRRVWRKEPKLISFLDPTFSYYLRRPAAKASLQTADRSRLKAFVAQLKEERATDNLDALEKTRLSQLNFLEKTMDEDSIKPEGGAV